MIIKKDIKLNYYFFNKGLENHFSRLFALAPIQEIK